MTESETPASKYWFGKRAPKQADAWFNYYKAAMPEGALDHKTKELIAVAIGSLLRCEHCFEAHSQEAMRSGASKEEIAEALMVASFMSAATQLFWSDKLEEYLGSDD